MVDWLRRRVVRRRGVDADDQCWLSQVVAKGWSAEGFKKTGFENMFHCTLVWDCGNGQVLFCFCLALL